MVGNDQFFLIGEDAALLLISGDDHLDALHQVFLDHKPPSFTDCPQRSFIYNIGQLGPRSTCSRPGYRCEVYIVRYLYFLCMYLQYFNTAFQVGQFNRYAPVKPARTKQGRIQHVRSVRGRKYDHAF